MTAPQSRSRRWPLLAAAGLLTLTLVGCGRESDGDPVAQDPAPESSTSAAEPEAPEDTASAPEAAGELPDWAPAILTEGDAVTGLDFTDTPEPGPELQVAVVTEGDGPEVEAGQSITVNYYGSLYQGEEPFDASYSRGMPATFGIGVGQVITGWDEGIPGVKVGSRIIMSIPADQAYGPAGRPPLIPGDSPLYFVVDILSANSPTS